MWAKYRQRLQRHAACAPVPPRFTPPWPLPTQVVAIGIGGSFLGPLFVHTSLKTDPDSQAAAKGRELRFLANVDPIDVARWGWCRLGRADMVC
jgi:glucose-6-phosphate isomerase